MSPDRKILIADTAIALLAELGARGLTHRAVDTRAKLALGSTSFYCRTRLDLLTLALRRHAALDEVDLRADVQVLMASAPSEDVFVDTLLARLQDWLSPAKRDRLIARFELFLIASREPGLADVVDGLRQHFLQGTQRSLQALGVPDPAHAAPALLTTVDGLLFAQVGRQAVGFDPVATRALLAQVLHLQARA